MKSSRQFIGFMIVVAAIGYMIYSAIEAEYRGSGFGVLKRAVVTDNSALHSFHRTVGAYTGMADSEASAQEHRTMSRKPAWFGCSDRSTFEQLHRIVGVDRDVDAFSTALAKRILTGQCVQLDYGTKVFIADTAMFRGLVKVSPRGSDREYWTNIEAVK